MYRLCPILLFFIQHPLNIAELMYFKEGREKNLDKGIAVGDKKKTFLLASDFFSVKPNRV